MKSPLRQKNLPYRTKKWNSLSDFKDYLIKTKKERVIEFYGYELITDKGSYGLVDGVLSFYSNPLRK